MKFKQLRPTVRTPFHIDWSWFERNNFDAEAIVRNQLCDTCRRQFEAGLPVTEVDYIDPETAEVIPMDNLREAILTHCRWEPDYIDGDTPLMQAILRLFLANNNHPLTPAEMGQRLTRRDADAILRVLTASGVQNGIVPVRG